MESEQQPKEGLGEQRSSAEQPIPNTRAPESGTPPVAGKVSPAEKSEPEGAISQEQTHNADPNAPQRSVVKPGETELSGEDTGGIPLSSLTDLPDLGTDEARKIAQVGNVSPPADAGAGSSSQRNEPSEGRRGSD